MKRQPLEADEKDSNNHKRRKIVQGMDTMMKARIGIIVGLAFLCLSAQPPKANLFPQLRTIGDTFSFAICADPQVSKESAKEGLGWIAAEALSVVVDEVNAMKPRPAFIVFNGDLVQTVYPEEFVDHFLKRVEPLAMLPIAVHGNHEKGVGNALFRRIQETLNGAYEYTFSFDCGRWHFVTIPSAYDTDNKWAKDALEFVKNDLSENRNRPTMAFVHYSLLPIGFTHMDYHTFDREYRDKLIDALAQHGNVRYVVSGHVHNGIKAAEKISWHYRGINFFVAPTITLPRHFDEEFPRYKKGVQGGAGSGGFYVMCHVQGDSITVNGRLIHVDRPYTFPQRFQEYTGQHPLWATPVSEQEPIGACRNGSFEDGLSGWNVPYRYVKDTDPGFVWKSDSSKSRSGKSSALLRVESQKGFWHNEELIELFQNIAVPAGSSTRFKAHYRIDRTGFNGCVYFRLCGYRGGEQRFLAVLSYGKLDTMRLSSYSAWAAGGPSFGIMKSRRRALLLDIPGSPNRWHTVDVNLAEIYDKKCGKKGAYKALGIDRVFLAFGVYAEGWAGSVAEAWFDDVALSPTAGDAARIR